MLYIVTATVFFIAGMILGTFLFQKGMATEAAKQNAKPQQQEPENTELLKQYINFSNYSGSGKGQKNIENEN